MQSGIFDAAIDWIAAYVPQGECIEITFHGGEPLLAGKEWYQRNLPILQQRFEGRLKLGIQSNLWLLDDMFCALFKEYGVSIGTSLDGPEKLNDAQRGKGYFTQTIAGINTARRNGLNPGVICTFTRHSAPHYREVFEFFASQGLSISVHEAVCKLGDNNYNKTALSPDKAAMLMVDLFNYYLENMTRIQITTFDSMARGISAQNGAICTFGNCLGKYLTVAPGGEIFSCNRFAQHPQWKLGSVFNRPDMEILSRSKAWQKLHQRELTVREDCGDCTHIDYCKGGCPYNAITGGMGRRDPQCTVYRQLFDHITTRALDEVFSTENLEVVIQQGGNGLMHKGRLIQIMKGSAHPQELTRKAREIVAAVALACSSTPEEALEKLDQAGIITHREAALGSLRSLHTQLGQQSQQGLVNVYLHVTYACNLTCTHCYARSGPGKLPVMRVEEVKRLALDAAATGFRKIVITGGEPMTHPQRDELLDTLAGLHEKIKPVQIVLRTNLAYTLPPDLMKRLAHSAEQIVVSVDGDEETHDARRGLGTYARTVENLHQLLEIIPKSKVLLTAVLTPEQVSSLPGKSVRDLGMRLGLRIRFKSVLPIGRGLDLGLTTSYYNSLDDSAETLAASIGPVATCGLGMNLYIGPHGDCYPCYALMGKTHALGNVLEDGLSEVLKQNDHYRRVTVDSNEKCQTCALRYLCGGCCRAWSRDRNPDSSPFDCTALQMRVQELLLDALETLGTTQECWQKAGLPLLSITESG